MFPISANWYYTNRRTIEDIGNRNRPATAHCGSFEQQGIDGLKQIAFVVSVIVF